MNKPIEIPSTIQTQIKKINSNVIRCTPKITFQHIHLQKSLQVIENQPDLGEEGPGSRGHSALGEAAADQTRQWRWTSGGGARRGVEPWWSDTVGFGLQRKKGTRLLLILGTAVGGDLRKKVGDSGFGSEGGFCVSKLCFWQGFKIFPCSTVSL